MLENTGVQAGLFLVSNVQQVGNKVSDLQDRPYLLFANIHLSQLVYFLSHANGQSSCFQVTIFDPTERRTTYPLVAKIIRP